MRASAGWQFQPHSWEKLAAIERWLDSPSAAAQPELAVEAVLQLAEGRLEFARVDRDRLDPAVLELRLGAARRGFFEVLGSSAATPTQLGRAHAGLRSAASLESAPRSTGPALVSRGQWGAERPIPSRMTRNTRSWTRITVHHSAEHSGKLGGPGAGASARAVQGIQSYHMHDPGRLYGDVGYHFLIDPAGRIYEGRGLEWQGAHAWRHNNVQNIGICVLGSFDDERPREAALVSLQALLDHLRARYSIPRSRVYGHREFRTTVCPGAHLMNWVKGYR